MQWFLGFRFRVRLALGRTVVDWLVMAASPCTIREEDDYVKELYSETSSTGTRVREAVGPWVCLRLMASVVVSWL